MGPAMPFPAHDLVRKQQPRNRYSPRTSLTNPNPRPRKVILQPLVMLRQSPQLELRHGLLMRAAAHLAVFVSTDKVTRVMAGKLMGGRVRFGSEERKTRDDKGTTGKEGKCFLKSDGVMGPSVYVQSTHYNLHSFPNTPMTDQREVVLTERFKNRPSLRTFKKRGATG